MGIDLNSKVGGIPVPVIGGVIGLAFVGFLYFRSASNNASAAPTTVAVPDLGPGDQIDSTGTQDGGIGADVAQFLSNGTWTATALAWETATNGTSPLTVQGALDRYMTGEALTWEDQQIVNRVIGKFGLPPQGVTGMSALLPKEKIPLKDPAVETPIPTPSSAQAPEYVPPKVNPYTDFIGALVTPSPSSTVGSSITTNYSSETGSIYNVSLNGVSRPIAESLVWSGAFNNGAVPAGYTAAEAAAVRDQLKLKGLAA